MKLIPEVYAVDLETDWPLAKTFTDFGSLISKLLPTILLVAAFIFFILVIFAGFSFLTAAGSADAQTKERWRMILTYGAIGLIIILGAFWVMQIINFITQGSLGSIFQ